MIQHLSMLCFLFASLFIDCTTFSHPLLALLAGALLYVAGQSLVFTPSIAEFTYMWQLNLSYSLFLSLNSLKRPVVCVQADATSQSLGCAPGTLCWSRLSSGLGVVSADNHVSSPSVAVFRARTHPCVGGWFLFSSLLSLQCAEARWWCLPEK